MGNAQHAPDPGDQSELRPRLRRQLPAGDLKPEGYNDRHAVNGSFTS